MSRRLRSAGVCFLGIAVSGLVLCGAGGARAAESGKQTDKTQEGNPGGSAWYPSYGPYAPYPGWWSGQGQEQAKEEEEKPKQIFQYDSKYRAAFEHPDIRTYGPQGDTRFEHGSTDSVTSPGLVSGGAAGGRPGGGLPALPGMIPETVQMPESVDVSLVPGRTDPENTVTLRLRTPFAYSGGCWTVGPLEYEKENQGKRMIVLVKGYRINPAGRTGRACNPLSRYAMADVPLRREELQGVETMDLKLGTRTDTYAVRLEKDALFLSPETMKFFKPFSKGGAGDSLHQAFVSGNLLALFVPAAQGGEDLTDQIRDFALARGLVPYGEPGAEDLPHELYGNRVWYFLDSKRALSSRVDEAAPRSVGTVLRKRVVRETPGFPGGVAERLDVYAAVP